MWMSPCTFGQIKMIITYLVLLNQFFVHIDASLDVFVPIFTNYTMPCFNNSLPKNTDRDQFNWFQDGFLVKGFNEIIQPNGDIHFPAITPDATGNYLCCYNDSNFIQCGEEINLLVEYPRPTIFNNAVFNFTYPINSNRLYWLPEMITKPLEYPNMSEPIDLTCSYYLKSIGVGRPNVFWTYNDRLPAGKHFEKLIPKSTGKHMVKTTGVPCVEDYLQGQRSHCFQSTLSIIPNREAENQRGAVYTCYVNFTNTISAQFRVGNGSTSVFTRSDMDYFKKNCYGEAFNQTQSLKARIEQLNACERNQFLGFWISPANNGRASVKCSRPLFVVFDEGLQVFELPANQEIVNKFSQIDKINSREDFYSILDKYRHSLLVSDRQDARLEDKDIHFHDAALEGSVFLGCQSEEVIVVCAYGPLFQMQLVRTGCKRWTFVEAIFYSGIFWMAVLLVLLTIFLILWYCRRRNSHKEIVWKTIDSYTSSYIVHSRLKTPSLPAPLLTSAKMIAKKPMLLKQDKYLKLDDNQWSPSVYKLRLEERIANGSYGDIFCGTLLTPVNLKPKFDAADLDGDEKMLEKRIVAKVLNDVFSREKMMEFANEVAILRLIGDHPNIIQFMGCAQRSNIGKQPVLLMEYASQGTLQNYLLPLRANQNTSLIEITMTYWWTRARRLIEDLLAFATDIANALVYLERIAVSHGDIAARNVLITNTYSAKLGDFGMACVIPQKETVNCSKIPVRWSAPEVVLSNRRHARSDVWSFGVLLWEIFSFGETPYAYIDSEEVVGNYVSIEGGRLSRPSTIAQDDYVELWQMMRSCWHASPELRPTFKEILEGLKFSSKKRRDSSISSDSGLMSNTEPSQLYLPMES